MLRRHIGFGINLGALGLFFPGILLPMFALNMEMAASLNNAALNSPLVDKELSIIATVQDLWSDDRMLVAALIFFFSICIPLLKCTAVSAAYFQRNVHKEQSLVGFVAGIGKWSMADVFVVAVFLAILSTNHAETMNTHQLSIFGMSFGLQVSTQTLSAVGQGFYFFASYCVLSLFGTHLYFSGAKKRAALAKANESEQLAANIED